MSETLGNFRLPTTPQTPQQRGLQIELSKFISLKFSILSMWPKFLTSKPGGHSAEEVRKRGIELFHDALEQMKQAKGYHAGWIYDRLCNLNIVREDRVAEPTEV